MFSKNQLNLNENCVSLSFAPLEASHDEQDNKSRPRFDGILRLL